MDRSQLWNLYQKAEKDLERRKLKRFAYTVLFYTVVLLVIFYWQDQLCGSILEILGKAFLCIIFAVVIVLINAVIFDQLFRLNGEDKAALENLKKSLENKE